VTGRGARPPDLEFLTLALGRDIHIFMIGSFDPESAAGAFRPSLKRKPDVSH
jgi:hypothetical protein